MCTQTDLNQFKLVFQSVISDPPHVTIADSLKSVISHMLSGKNQLSELLSGH